MVRMSSETVWPMRMLSGSTSSNAGPPFAERPWPTGSGYFRSRSPVTRGSDGIEHARRRWIGILVGIELEKVAVTRLLARRVTGHGADCWLGWIATSTDRNLLRFENPFACVLNVTPACVSFRFLWSVPSGLSSLGGKRTSTLAAWAVKPSFFGKHEHVFAHALEPCGGEGEHARAPQKNRWPTGRWQIVPFPTWAVRATEPAT